MARPGGPWWWAARGRWAATIAGARRTAPKGVERRDEAAAWAWYAAEVAEAGEPTADVRVIDVFNIFLDRAAQRLAAGDLAERTLALWVVIARKAAGTVLPGGKFGALAAASVERRHLEALAAKWAQGRGVRKGSRVSPSYLNTACGVVRTAFRWAARPDDGRAPLIPSDPTAGWKLPRARAADVRVCGRSEAAAWLRWCRRDARHDAGRNFLLLQRLLLATGARPSELTGATWGEVAWSAGTTASGASYGIITRAEWKNARKGGKPRRIILTPAALRPLRRLHARTSPAPDDPIFRASRGGAWDASKLAQATRAVRERARAAKVDLGGLEGEGPGRARGYLWRHLAASRLIEAGVDLATAGELLGTSAAMLAKTYSHLADGRLAAAASLTTGRPGRGRRDGPPSA